MSDADRKKWNRKYQSGDDIPGEPSRVLRNLQRFLPAQGTAIDVAGGAGRHAIWLAQQGLRVTLADISRAGLELASRRARDAGVRLATREIDLQQEAFPAGPWDLVLSNAYLQRELFAVFPRVLRPAGILVFAQPTRRNLERYAKPPAPFLLEEGELAELLQGLTVLYYEEGWLAEGRHEAVVVARRDATRPPGGAAAD